MQYLLLIYSQPGAEPKYGDPGFTEMLSAYNAFTAKLKADGAFVAGDALQPVTTATSVRVRGGKVETMDGPFAETKEHLGGYYLVNAADLDAALAYAALIPTAARGTVEVRPVVAFN